MVSNFRERATPKSTCSTNEREFGLCLILGSIQWVSLVTRIVSGLWIFQAGLSEVWSRTFTS